MMLRSLLSLLPHYLLLLLLDQSDFITARTHLHSSKLKSLQSKATSRQTIDYPTLSFYSSKSLVCIARILENLRGGGNEDYHYFEGFYDEHVSEEDEPKADPSTGRKYDRKKRSTQSGRDPHRSRPRPGYNQKSIQRRRRSSLSSLSSVTNAASVTSKIVGKSLSTTGSLAFNALIKTPGKLAFHVIRPKHVDLSETFGLWRLDQEVVERSNWNGDNERTITSVATVEFSRSPPLPRDNQGRPRRGFSTPRPPLIFVRHNRSGSGGGEDDGSKEKVYRAPYSFVQKNKYLKGASLSSFQTSFVAPAFLVGENQARLYGYKGTWHRKLADKSVIKLKGKIYQVHKQKFGKKRGEYVYGPAVGRFVMRRRISMSEEEHDRQDSSDVDEEVEELEDDYEQEYDNEQVEYTEVEDDKYTLFSTAISAHLIFHLYTDVSIVIHQTCGALLQD